MPPHTWMLLHRAKGCFLQRHSFTHKLVGFTQWCFYAQELLHTDAQVFLHTDAFTQRWFYTGLLIPASAYAFTWGFFWHNIRSLYTQKLLHKYSHTEMAPTQEHIYIEAFFAHRYFYKVFCCIVFYRKMLLHTGAFRLGHLHGRGWKHSFGGGFQTILEPGFHPFSLLRLHTKNACREMVLHTSALRHKYFFTDMMLQTGDYTKVLYAEIAFSHRCSFLIPRYFYTVLLHAGSLMQRFFYPQIHVTEIL